MELNEHDSGEYKALLSRNSDDLTVQHEYQWSLKNKHEGGKMEDQNFEKQIAVMHESFRLFNFPTALLAFINSNTENCFQYEYGWCVKRNIQ